jgi:hypothetical protein
MGKATILAGTNLVICFYVNLLDASVEALGLVARQRAGLLQ